MNPEKILKRAIVTNFVKTEIKSSKNVSMFN